MIPKVYLASKSPRRRALLSACHIPFELVEAEIDESQYPENLPQANIAEYLADLKAAKAMTNVPDSIVVAADSLVICEGEVLGKPVDASDAARMLRLLSGKRHLVTTGVCVRDETRKVLFSDLTYVTFQELAQDEIQYYIEHYQPFDKAGAYAVQEWIGHCKILRIEGSYTNIMGLPTERVYRVLREWNRYDE